MLTKESFLEAGFDFHKENPIFPFTKCLASSDEEIEEGLTMPDVGYSTEIASFYIADPCGNLMYFNAESPKEAVEWASKITLFEPNF